LNGQLNGIHRTSQSLVVPSGASCSRRLSKLSFAPIALHMAFAQTPKSALCSALRWSATPTPSSDLVSPLAGVVVSCSGPTRFLTEYKRNSQYRCIFCRLQLVRLFLLCLTRSYRLMTSIMSEPLTSFKSAQIDLVDITGDEESNIEKVREPFLEENKCLPQSHLGFRCIAH
jgi:hypothetical protein